MALDRLTLTDFRSYATLDLAPAPGFVVLTGDNGAGKTNILEAVSLLAPGRGLRGAALGDMARRDGGGGFAVAARTGDGTAIGTGTSAAAPERRIVRINGAGASATALAERVSVLWLTPAQDRLFTDSAGSRRRFLDRLVLALEPAHARHAARYEAAMRQRNRLLADGSGDAGWLDALEAAMAEHGTAIAVAREHTVADLAACAVPDPSFPVAALALSNPLPADLRDELRRSRPRDAAAGRSSVGPHTQDLLVRYASKDEPAAQCSTGEQKALLIGIVLAHAELVAGRTGQPPILLLDEVAAHLDRGRRAALFERLAGRGQVWMTGTERGAFAAASDAGFLRVENSRVEG